MQEVILDMQFNKEGVGSKELIVVRTWDCNEANNNYTV